MTNTKQETPLPTGEHPWAQKLWLYRKYFLLGDLVISVVVTIALFAGPAERWANMILERVRSPWLSALLFCGGLAVAYGLPALPLRVGRHELERKFGLSTQAFRSWLIDQLKGMALGAVLGSIVVLGLVACLLYAKHHWWWVASIGAALFGTVLTRLAPQLIIPLFFKMKPLQDAPLQESFQEISRKTGTPVLGVYEINLSTKTNAANAAVVGFGSSRRAVVGDTLLSKFTPKEVEFVLTHELAHHRYHDLWWGIALGSLLTLAGLAATHQVIYRATEPPGAVIVALQQSFNPVILFWIAVLSTLFGMALSPISKYFSRRAETRADRFAVDATGLAQPGAEAFRKLGFQNLARFQPPAWEELLMHTHPSISRRIARLEALSKNSTEAPS